MSLDALRQDLAYAARGLRRKPAFTIAVALTLALGIGANAAMFGIVDRLLFRPPPLLRDAALTHRIYTAETYRGTEHIGSVGRYARYVDLTKWTSSFSRTAGYSTRAMAVGVGDAAREMQVGVVSASFFDFFDAPPVLGRYFTAAEDQPPAGQPVVVLSHAFWETRYAKRRDVLGEKLQIGPTIYTVIGVAAPGFVGLSVDRPPAAFIPITSYAAGAGVTAAGKSWWTTYSWGWMQMIATRKPGVTIAEATSDLTQAEVRSYQAQREEQPRVPSLELAKPRAMAGSILAERGPNATSVGKVATWVGGVSVLVLLIACANVANLLLARAISRRREVALRVALGVRPLRLATQFLVESLLLSALGGLAGLMIAHGAGRVLRASLFEGSEAANGFRDPRTLGFALVVSVLVGVVSGLAPIVQARRTDLTNDLKAGMRDATYGRSRLRPVLLGVQAALSVVLLVGAGLFVRSMRNASSVRLGFDVEPVLLVDINNRGTVLDSAAAVQLRERLYDAAASMPEVVSVSRQTAVPFWSMTSLSLFVAGIDTVGRLGQFDMNAVSPSFFTTVGTRIIRGRGITDADVATAPRVMVVSDRMGKTLWPGRDPIGQCVRVSADTMPCTYVVGIAEDIKEQSLGADSSRYYYLPAAQYRPAQGGLFVRVRGVGAARVDAIRRRLQREMPGASYVTVTPLAKIIGGEMRSWRLGATMFVAFGALAIVLAAVGLYSVIAYNVAQRTHELGVRRALGAQAGDVVRLVVGEGIRVAGVGVAAGVVLALVSGRWIAPLLFQVSPRDPAVFVAVTAVLLVIAALASWIPATRASRVDANTALRAD